MANVRLTWGLPPVSPRQRPHDYTEISFRVDASLPWTVQDNVLAGAVQELLFVDQAPGEMFYQAVLYDIDGQPAPPVETSISLPFDAPDAVVSFSATAE